MINQKKEGRRMARKVEIQTKLRGIQKEDYRPNRRNAEDEISRESTKRRRVRKRERESDKNEEKSGERLIRRVKNE